uniref:Uncharacterized protein n=1 Tax=Strongyloides venezuelensis TaxID=75913 RepID=A0A0K0FZC5_STRVS
MNLIPGCPCSHSHLINLLIKGKGYVAIDENRKRTLKLQLNPLFQGEVLEPSNVNSSILIEIDENGNISVENLEIVHEIDLNVEINAKVEQLLSKLVILMLKIVLKKRSSLKNK